MKRQGLFDDPTEEINSLIFRIKQDLDDMNSKCNTAQQFIDSKKSLFSVGKSNQSTEHNTKVVSHLKTDLMQTTKDFKQVLELRSSKMKDQQLRKVELIGKSSFLSPMKTVPLYGADNQRTAATERIDNASSSASSSSSSSSSSNTQESLSVRHAAPQRAFMSPYMTSADDGSLQSHSLPHHHHQQQQQQLLLAPIAESQYYDSREQAVSEVERTIGELGQLFKRLATMISEQQSLVERIDEDVENTISNADKAHALLLKSYEKASSNRGLYFKILGILAIFILFFVLFLL